MFNPRSKTRFPHPAPAAVIDKAARADWENEGGAMREGPATQGPAVVEQQAPTAAAAARQTAAVDAVQDELMRVGSPDGAPPARVWRLAGWHWWAVVVPVLLVLGGLIWIAVAFGIVSALFGLVILGTLGAAAAPVWGAGLMRGKEGRAARVEALAEVGGGPERRTGGGEGAPVPLMDRGSSGL